MSKFDSLFVPQDQSKQIKDIGIESRLPSESIEKNWFQGADDAKNTIMSAGLNSDPNLSYGVGPGLMEAIHRRASLPYEQDYDQFKTNMSIQAKNEKFKRLQTAASLAGQELAHNEQVRAMIRQERQNRKRARAGVLGGILGIGGAVAGGMAGKIGGPQGAAMGAGIGYNLGSGLGNTFGGDL